MRATRSITAVALAASVLLLAACGTIEEPLPPGVTDEEIQVYLDAQNDQWWEAITSGQPGDYERPDVEVVEYIEGGEWAETMAGCLTEQGIEGVSASAGGLHYNGLWDLEYQIAEYTCGVMYPFEQADSGYLGKAQLEYVYDYWSTHTTPCLELLGIDVPPMPVRREFVDDYPVSIYWSPYTEIEHDYRVAEIDPRVNWDLIDFRCPPLPSEFGMWSPGQRY